jgi:hypothetical protein
MRQRQLTRFFNLMSLSYWPERGGSLQTTIHFKAFGSDGSNWHLKVAPDGGSAGDGHRPPAGLTLWFRNVDALCRALTLRLTPLRAMLTGQAIAWGNLPLLFRMRYLFLAA